MSIRRAFLVALIASGSLFSGAEAKDVGFFQPQTLPPLYRFSCTYSGVTFFGKGSVPQVCTVFGDFFMPTGMTTDNRLTLVCGTNVLYSDAVIASFPTNDTTELRSIVPGAIALSLRTHRPGVFTGTLSSALRIDLPDTPPTLLTGACHLSSTTYASVLAEVDSELSGP